jgi:hypothetical protein
MMQFPSLPANRVTCKLNTRWGGFLAMGKARRAGGEGVACRTAAEPEPAPRTARAEASLTAHRPSYGVTIMESWGTGRSET